MCLVPVLVFVHVLVVLDVCTFVGEQLLIFSLHMWKNNYPVNMYLLAGFTLLESCMVAGVCAHYEVWLQPM